MQEDKYRQFHIDFELTNNINSAWRISDILRGRSISIYQLIGLLGYKYLSENVKNNKDDIGYELNEELYYENLLINKGNVIDTLKEGIKQITQNNDNVQAADVFYDLFSFIDFETFNKNDTWLSLIDATEKLCSETIATIGEVIIFLTKYTTSTGGPQSGGLKPTEDIIKLMTTNQKDVKNIYDPFVDEATLLAEIGNVINVENYYGQHPNLENCALAKMTLLANNVNYKNIFIKCNDITESINWNVKFDLCASIPPFGRRLKFNGQEDIRFKPYTPRKSELAYLLDMYYNLDDEGTIKMIVPNGVLFSSPDKKIIKYLVDNELISSIIGLPGGLFDITSISTSMLMINKKPTDNGIYYLNLLGAQTKKELQRKVVSILDIDKYIELLSDKTEQKLTSKIAIIDEIRENDYNIAINRYVDLEELKVFDIEKTISNIKEIKMELKQIDEELNVKLGCLFK
jgi:type I restriction-modification system DNA methylase subunit|nr:N-6 DNA methylase [Methanobrevibacter smithii]